MVFGFPSGGCWSDPKRVWRRWDVRAAFFWRENQRMQCNAMQCNLFFMQNKKRLQERFHNLFFWIVTLPKTNMIPKMKVWFRWFPFQTGDFQVESAVHLSRVKGAGFWFTFLGWAMFGILLSHRRYGCGSAELWQHSEGLWRQLQMLFVRLFFDRFRDVMLDGHFRIVIWVMVLYIRKVFDAPMEVGRFSNFL